jgi:hypothetical protein
MRSVRLKDDDIDRLSYRKSVSYKVVEWVLILASVLVSFYIMTHVAHAHEPSQYDVLVYDPPTEEEYDDVEAAIAMCGGRTTREIADPFKVLALIRLEQALGFPSELRGIFNAIWCIESSMRSESKNGGPILGDNNTSFGPMQMKKQMVQTCIMRHDLYADDPRAAPHDLIWAAKCWAARIMAIYPKAAKQCPGRPWPVAEAMISNYSRYSIKHKDGTRTYNCTASSKHYKLLKGT